MTIFVAAGDETDDPKQKGPFFYGGFVASLSEWTTYFGPAWQERVLNGRRGQPTIPFLHMTDIRSPRWRAEHGLSSEEAERRVDEACRVLYCSGSLAFCYSGMDGGHFRSKFKKMKVIRPTKQPGTYPMLPDYMGFLGFAYAAVEYVHDHRADAERVSFVVERKDGVTLHINDFHDGIAEGLREKGQAHLALLVGDVTPAGKEHFGLQAADVALWHWRRLQTGTCERPDLRRCGDLFNLRPIMSNGPTVSEVDSLHKKWQECDVPSPFTEKPKQRKDGGDV